MTRYVFINSKIKKLFSILDSDNHHHEDNSCFNRKIKHHVEKVVATIAFGLVLVNAHFLIWMEKTKVELKERINWNETFLRFFIDQNNESNIYICFPEQNSLYAQFLNEVWIYVDLSIFSFFPFLVMVISSLFIWAHLSSKRFKQTRLSLTKRDTFNKKICSRNDRRNKQTLCMLLVTNGYFIVCSLPYCTLNFMFNYSPSANWVTWLLVVNALAYSHNSINFVFYLLFSQKYRQTIAGFLFKKPVETHESDNNGNIMRLNRLDQLEKSFKMRSNNFGIGTQNDHVQNEP